MVKEEMDLEIEDTEKSLDEALLFIIAHCLMHFQQCHTPSSIWKSEELQ